jgi:hypothetical protein
VAERGRRRPSIHAEEEEGQRAHEVQEAAHLPGSLPFFRAMAVGERDGGAGLARDHLVDDGNRLQRLEADVRDLEADPTPVTMTRTSTARGAQRPASREMGDERGGQHERGENGQREEEGAAPGHRR